MIPPDRYTELLAQIDTEGALGRVRFLSVARGFGFIQGLDEGFDPNCGDWFFHVRFLLARDRSDHELVFERIIASPGFEPEADLVAGPFVRFVPAPPPNPKGPAAMLVLLIEGQELVELREKIGNRKANRKEKVRA